MNWGKGIALAYTVFVIGMLGMVYLAVSQDFDLVAEDYYEQEIAYQGRIDQMTNASNDGQKMIISKKEDNYTLNFSEAVEDVKIHFFRPSDENQDLILEQDAVESAMLVASNRLALGKYLVKAEWKANGKTYFQEQDLIVN